jgi:hypothetical protein
MASEIFSIKTVAGFDNSPMLTNAPPSVIFVSLTLLDPRSKSHSLFSCHTPEAYTTNYEKREKNVAWPPI